LISTFWYRDSASAPWREIVSFSNLGAGLYPIAFAADGTLYVSSNRLTNTASIYKFDPTKNGEGERIVYHPTADIGFASDHDQIAIGAPASPLVFDSESNELIGVAIEGDKPEFYWLRADEDRVQRAIDGALPGKINHIRKLPLAQYFVRSTSDRDPGTYYIFDSTKGRLQEIGRPYKNIDPKKMGATEVVRYKARDGLEIPGYLTLPTGKAARNLPLVVWVHGGPWARDEFGWEYEVQFMVSRGYAVFQPNYRGSTGLGRKHFESSFKKLGQSMQDDVSDGVDYLTAKGIVDPKRVCIGGGSYGGYATMMGLVKEPGRYRCGIDVVGVVDLFWWLELGYTDFNLIDAEATTAFLSRTVGDPGQDEEMMRANSPRLHPEKVQAPVLFVQGGGDMRVPIKHAESMRDGLKSLGKPFEWVVYPEEGHGFMKEENRADYLRHIESFLAKHLGRAE
jgi:dipeptidyl aminopeptidase/acylaminoacyl peptidase